MSQQSIDHTSRGDAPWSPLSTAEAPAEAVDSQRLLVNVGDDLQTLGEIIDCYQEDAVARLAELAVAVNQQRREAIVRSAHVLRGATANFSVGSTYTACAALESLAKTGTWESIARVHAHLIRAQRGLSLCLAAVRKQYIKE